MSLARASGCHFPALMELDNLLPLAPRSRDRWRGPPWSPQALIPAGGLRPLCSPSPFDPQLANPPLECTRQCGRQLANLDGQVWRISELDANNWRALGGMVYPAYILYTRTAHQSSPLSDLEVSGPRRDLPSDTVNWIVRRYGQTPGRKARHLHPPSRRPALPGPPMGRCQTNKSSQGRADAQ